MNVPPIDIPVFVGMKGSVLALNRADGRVLWQTPLKGSAFVNVTYDVRTGDLLAATRGEVFCLDPRTGAIRWNNPMTGMGYGFVTFGVANDGSTTAVAAAMAAAEEQSQQSAQVSTNTTVFAAG